MHWPHSEREGVKRLLSPWEPYIFAVLLWEQLCLWCVSVSVSVFFHYSQTFSCVCFSSRCRGSACLGVKAAPGIFLLTDIRDTICPGNPSESHLTTRGGREENIFLFPPLSSSFFVFLFLSLRTHLLITFDSIMVDPIRSIASQLWVFIYLFKIWTNI